MDTQLNRGDQALMSKSSSSGEMKSSTSFLNITNQPLDGSKWLEGIPINVNSVFLVMAKGQKALNRKMELLDQADAILDKAEKSGDPEEFEESLMEIIDRAQCLNQQIPEKWLKKNIGLVIEGAGEATASEDDGDYDDDQPQMITEMGMGADCNESTGEQDKHREQASKVLEEALYDNKFHDVMGSRMRELVISATSVLHVVQEAESTRDEAELKRCMKVLNEAVEDVASRVTQPSNQECFKQEVKAQMKVITDLLSKRLDAKQ